MRRVWLLSFITLLGVTLLASCTPNTSTDAHAPTVAAGSVGKQVATQGGVYTDIPPQDLHTMLANKDFTFVNVHVPFEGNIPQTDVSIPYDQIPGQLDKLPADRSAKIVLYCRSGRMSTEAAQVLVKQGYTNVFQLAGGMIAWEKTGYPINLNP